MVQLDRLDHAGNPERRGQLDRLDHAAYQDYVASPAYKDHAASPASPAYRGYVGYQDYVGSPGHRAGIVSTTVARRSSALSASASRTA